MKKKLFTALLLSIAALCAALIFPACIFGGGDDDNDNGDGGGSQTPQYYHVRIYVPVYGITGELIYFNHEVNETVNTLAEVDEIIAAFQTPEIEDHAFDTWYTDEECTQKWTGVSQVGDSEVNIYAGYILNAFKLRLPYSDSYGDIKVNGVYSDDKNVKTKFAEGESVTLIINSNKYVSGESFMGWYEGEELVCKTKEYTFEMPAREVQLSVHWQGFGIKISNEGNENTEAGTTTNANRNGYVEAGTEASVIAQPAGEGTFLGWYDAAGKTLLSSELNYKFTMPEKNVSLTAKWAAYTANTVAEGDSDGAAGAIVGGYNNKYVTAGNDVNLKAEVKDGYYFLGWYDGETLLSKNLEHTVKMPAENATYTAKWTYYTATTLIDGETGAGKIIDGYDGVKVSPENDVVLKVEASDRYTFTGWYLGDTLLSEESEFTAAMPAENAVFKAKIEKFTVTTKSNEGVGVEAYEVNRTVTFINLKDEVLATQTLGVGDKIDIAAAFALGYTRWKLPDGKYWDYSSDFEGDLVLKGSTSDTNYCVGASNYVNIKAGGTIWDIGNYGGASPKSERFIVPVTGSYNFYTRLHWYYENQNTVLRVYNETQGKWIYENSRTTATWKSTDEYNKPFSYLAAFSANLGDVIRVDCYNYFNCKHSSNSNDFYIEGPTYPKQGGGLKDFAGDDGLGISAGRTVTLKATPKAGYTFLGWHDGESIVSTDLVYTFTMGAKSREFEAKWAKYSVSVESTEGGAVSLSRTAATVTFDLNGHGANPPAPQIVTRADGLKMPEIPTASGYVFRGWYADAECSGDVFDFSSEIADDTTLYAGWYEINPDASVRYNVVDDMFDYSENMPFRDNSLYKSNVENGNKCVAEYFRVPVSGQYKFSAFVNKNYNNPADYYGAVINAEIYRDNSVYGKYAYGLTCYSDGTIRNATVELKEGDIVMMKIYRNNYLSDILYHEVKCWFEYLGDEPFEVKEGGVLSPDAEAVTSVAESEARAFAAGESVTVKAVAESGKSFVGWYNGDGELVSSEEVYTFVMPEGDLELTARFE